MFELVPQNCRFPHTPFTFSPRQFKLYDTHVPNDTTSDLSPNHATGVLVLRIYYITKIITVARHPI